MTPYKSPLDHLIDLSGMGLQKWLNDLNRWQAPLYQLPTLNWTISEVLRSSVSVPDYSSLQGLTSALESLKIPTYSFNVLDSPLQVALANLTQNTAGMYSQAFNGFAAIIERFLDTDAWLSRTELLQAIRISEALAAYRWWYVPTLPRELMAAMCDIAETDDGRNIEARRRSINTRICRYIRERNFGTLRSVVDGWYDVPYFQERRRIFEAAFQAHLRRDFYSSVALLLPQIEGIAHAFLKAIELPKKSINRNDWKILVGVFGISETGPNAVIADSFSNALTSLFFFEFYPDKGYRRGTLINRHAILHGKLLTYGTETNSVRAFLALETHHHYFRAIHSTYTLPELTQYYRMASQGSKAANANH